MLGHQNIIFKSWYILVAPGWMLKLLLCPSSKIIFLSSGIFGTQILSWSRKATSNPTLKLLSLPYSIASNWVLWKGSVFWPSLISPSNSLVILKVPNLTLLGVTSHARLRSLNCSRRSISLTIKANICRDFLLKASATTLALPGW